MPHHRGNALLCVSALLCHLVYFHSPAVFDTRALCTLGLVLRDSFTSPCHTKFIVLSRGTPGELTQMRAGYEEAKTLRDASPSQQTSPLAWFAMKRRLKSRLEYNRRSSMFCGSLFSDAVNDALCTTQLASHLTDDDIFVVFRGTKITSRLNLQSGADATWAPCDDISPSSADARAHGGFKRAFERIRERLDASLRAHAPATGPSRVIMTGHSRGGALAQLAAWAYGDRAPGLITFGAPATFNSAACAHVHDAVRFHARVAHRQDRIAQWRPANDYEHVADKASRDLEHGEHPRRTASCSQLQAPPSLTASEWNPLSCHRMITYIATIFRKCGLHRTLTSNEVQHTYDAHALGWSAWEVASSPSTASPAQPRPPPRTRTRTRTRLRSESRPRSRKKPMAMWLSPFSARKKDSINRRASKKNR